MPRSKGTSTPDRAPSGAQPRYRFVGGKGGVGKTTCAAALAVACARRGLSTLVVSTDPAPSLADALGQPLGAKPRPVRGVARLHAVEVDAPAALARWIDARRNTLSRIALRGTWLDRDDVKQILDLSLPGIDEIAGLLELVTLGANQRYDRIIVDAAPTGHLLRMLEMPGVLDGVARVFDHMQDKHRIMVDALRGCWTPDDADALISEIADLADRLTALLRDPAETLVSWVTLPEAMSVEETADALAWLREQRIGVDRLIINRVTLPPPQPCRWCRARRSVEADAIRALFRNPHVRSAAVVSVPAVPREPRGVRALAAIGTQLERPSVRTAGAAKKPVRPLRAVQPVRGRTPAGGLTGPETRLVLFGGKGGVGKTTCAAAAALTAATESPDRRVLLLSTDPAHSLGDVFGQKFSDATRRVLGGPSNLFVRELDAARTLDRFRERLGPAIEEMLERDGMSAGAGQQDRQAVHDLLALAPPGIDEIVAVMEIADSVDTDRESALYDLAVMDTAPTGHALRLIEMPALVHAWLKALMSILLKYQPIVGLGALGAELLRMSQGIGRLRTVLADPSRSQFIVVTRTGALPRAETVRLLARLEAAGVNVPVVAVNALGAGTCRRCAAELAAQRTETAALRRAAGPRRIIVTPAELPPPLGPDRLRDWRRTWRVVDRRQ